MAKTRYHLGSAILEVTEIEDFKRFAEEENRTSIGQVAYLMSTYVRNKRRLEAAELLLSKDLNEIE
jgi:hypothetical protein